MNREPLASRTLTGYLWSSRARLWRGLGLALLRSLAVAPCPWLFQRMIDVAVPAREAVVALRSPVRVTKARSKVRRAA